MPSFPSKINFAVLSFITAMSLIQALVIPISSSHSLKSAVIKDNKASFLDKYVSESDYQKVAKQVLEKRDEDGIIVSCTVPNTLAITFDDGPFEYTEALLDFLKEEDAKVTFFLNGNSGGDVYEYSSAVKRAYEEGHQIGLHTWSHADLTRLSDSGIEEEMSRIDDAVKEIIGVRAVYMRPPFGYVNKKSKKYLFENGYKIVNWSIDTNDWRHPGNVQASMKVYRSALSRTDARKGGYIVLQHDTIESTAQVLAPAAVKYAKENGFK
ncbi:hypothetical protein BGX27_000759, partial [Mortierella sp. AM989]